MSDAKIHTDNAIQRKERRCKSDKDLDTENKDTDINSQFIAAK